MNMINLMACHMTNENENLHFLGRNEFFLNDKTKYENKFEQFGFQRRSPLMDLKLLQLKHATSD